MDNNAKKVAIYARVSSDKQDVDLSISAQLKELKNFAITHPNVVYIDEALGGPDFEIELYMKTKQEYYEFLTELRYKFSDLIRDFRTLHYPEEFKLVLFPWKGRIIQERNYGK